jgi:hypothetical protein
MTGQSDSMRWLRAVFSPLGAVATLPCGSRVIFTRHEVDDAVTIECMCVCGSKHSLVPLPDHALELMGSYTRNEPGTVIVLALD